jgi:membrane-associated phospholipid phosphatase
VGKHFLCDVIVGIMVGLIAGYAFGYPAKATIKSFFA